jgi:hypothetical protein
MTIQTTLNLPLSIRTKFMTDYLQAAMLARVYDQFASPIGQDDVDNAARLATAVQVPFLSDMRPGVTPISQTQDITPQILLDAIATVTPTSRGEALQWSEALEMSVYTNYAAERAVKLGKNQMESVDLLAQAQATQGAVFNRATATRVLLDAGTAAHRLDSIQMDVAHTQMVSLKVPAFTGNGMPQWVALMDAANFHDLRLSAPVLATAQNQRDKIIFNFELATVGPWKIIVSPWVKKFYGAGAANALPANTTMTAASLPLATTITVANAANAQAGRWLNIIDLPEPGNVHSPTNERVICTGVNGLVLTVVGEADNGGLRFAHPAGTVVTNADSVYPVVYGGPASLCKLYDNVTGEFGQVVGPQDDGILKQFRTIGWKFYGGYGRWVESWLLRSEHSTSVEA